MGFFDKVKSVAMKAKCGAGIHGGDYHNVEGKPKCYFEKTCPDCKEIIKKNEHKFGKATYIKENSCKQEKTCIVQLSAHCVAKHNERKKGVNTVALNNDKWFTIIATFCVIVNRTDGTSRQVNIFKLTF